jgi:nucleotide-binding universal stress UspA family protein
MRPASPPATPLIRNKGACSFAIDTGHLITEQRPGARGWVHKLPAKGRRRSVMMAIKKILFPCDLTQHSVKILKYALALADTFGSRVFILHVVQDLRAWAGLYMPHKRLDLEQREVVEHAQKSLIQFCLDIPEARTKAEKRVVSGDPAEEIIKSAVDERADLIVMGTHGRKGLEYSLFGSVATKVVRNSPVPVLTINPDRLT